MKVVQRSELLSLDQYELIRPHFRARVIEEKNRRRARLGDDMSIVFENHDTVLLQIQEMLRTEHITKEQGVIHELVTYNELVPSDDELSMTLFIEIDDRAERDRKLALLAGVEKNVRLEIDGEAFPATAAHRDGQVPERATAVQYYKITLSKAAADKLRKGGVERVAVVVDHPAYRARAELGGEVLRELAGDLTWSS